MTPGSSIRARLSPTHLAAGTVALCALLAAADGATAEAAPLAPGTIITVAGGGTGGDGIPATQSKLRKPRRTALLPGGGFLVVEFGGEATYGDGRVRKVAPDGTITTVAGNGVEGFSGDGGPAVAAQMNGPTDVILSGDGSFLIADEFNHRIRRVADGIISTVAGAPEEGCGAQSGPAIDAHLTWPRSIAMEEGGESYLLVDENCALVHRVSAGDDEEIGTADDAIATVAGRGDQGFSGDGGRATSARLHAPRGVAALPGGAFLIADSLNGRVRRVGTNGVITTVAGTGANAFGADGGYAVDTPLSIPRDVEAAPGGGFLIAESGSNRIRRVAANGVITTIAGTGYASSAGDGGPATAAGIDEPHGVSVSPQGDVYISGPGLNDTSPGEYRVRRVEGPLPAPPPLPPSDPPPPTPEPLPPVAPPTVEAPPPPMPMPMPAPVMATATPTKVMPPLRVRVVVRARRVRAGGARLTLRLIANQPLLGRWITVQDARRARIGRRFVYRYRPLTVATPWGRRAQVRVRLRGAGRHRVRITWTDAGRRHSSSPIVLTTPTMKGSH